MPNKISKVVLLGNCTRSQSFLDFLHDITPNIKVVRGEFDSDNILLKGIGGNITNEEIPTAAVFQQGIFRIGCCSGYTVVPKNDPLSLSALARQLDVDILLWGGSSNVEAYTLDGKFFIHPGSCTGAFNTDWPIFDELEDDIVEQDNSKKDSKEEVSESKPKTEEEIESSKKTDDDAKSTNSQTQDATEQEDNEKEPSLQIVEDDKEAAATSTPSNEEEDDKKSANVENPDNKEEETNISEDKQGEEKDSTSDNIKVDDIPSKSNDDNEKIVDETASNEKPVETTAAKNVFPICPFQLNGAASPSFVLLDIQGNICTLFVYMLIDGDVKVDKVIYKKELDG